MYLTIKQQVKLVTAVSSKGKSFIIDGRKLKSIEECKNGKLCNTDINSVLNIMRESKVVSLNALYTRGEVDTPIRIRIA